MTESDIRNGLDKTEFEKNGWKIVILEYDNETVKGRYELKKWENKPTLSTYRENFIEGLTKALISKIIPPIHIHRSDIEGEEEDFGI